MRADNHFNDLMRQRAREKAEAERKEAEEQAQRAWREYWDSFVQAGGCGGN